jgi:CBS domain-containing protein
VSVTRATAAVSDAAITRFIQLAAEELGPSPAPFAFVVLGSAGRREQTFNSDQDNAIVYDHPRDEAAVKYFLTLGERVCDWLSKAGYPFCNGGVMARNPKWCQPLGQFQEMFTRWTVELQDQDLMDVNICFDFRCAFGDSGLTDALRKHVFQAVKDKPRFLFHLAETTLQFKPPVGFFGGIQVEGTGEHAEAFNLKNCLIPIVNFARIYALHHNIAATHTLERLRGLWESGVLARTTYDEVCQAYNELMRLRFKHQAAQLSAGQAANNYVNPARLTQLERGSLKRIFSDIAVLQARLTTDFARTV